MFGSKREEEEGNSNFAFLTVADQFSKWIFSDVHTYY